MELRRYGTGYDPKRNPSQSREKLGQVPRDRSLAVLDGESLCVEWAIGRCAQNRDKPFCKVRGKKATYL